MPDDQTPPPATPLNPSAGEPATPPADRSNTPLPRAASPQPDRPTSSPTPSVSQQTPSPTSSSPPEQPPSSPSSDTSDSDSDANIPDWWKRFNLILLGLVAVLLIAVGVSLVRYMYKAPVSQTTLPPSAPVASSSVSRSNAFDINTPEKPLNQLAFEEARAQIQGARVQESRITGVLKQAQKTEEGGILLKLELSLIHI